MVVAEPPVKAYEGMTVFPLSSGTGKAGTRKTAQKKADRESETN